MAKASCDRYVNLYHLPNATHNDTLGNGQMLYEVVPGASLAAFVIGERFPLEGHNTPAPAK